jgi:hypothetical protein
VSHLQQENCGRPFAQFPPSRRGLDLPQRREPLLEAPRPHQRTTWEEGVMTKSRLVLVEQHNIECNTFFTTPLFWDCECEDGYIRTCLEEDCPLCGVTREDSPDARVDEVFSCSTELNDKLIAVLEMICDRVCPDLVSIPF